MIAKPRPTNDGFTVRAKVFEWRGPAPYHFVAVTGEAAEEIRDVAASVTYGWGMIPIEGRVGRTSFKTALWPKNGSYVIPLKDAVRTAEQIELGDVISVEMRVTEPQDRNRGRTTKR